MTPERIAELDAKAGMALTGPKATDDFAAALVMAYPDLRAHIEAQAATIARLDEALREIVASDSPLGRNGVPSHKEIARRALKGIDHE